jgi:hypothetical protein
MEASASASTPRRSGWVTFVGVLFLIAGGFDVIWGLAGLGVSLGGSDQLVLGDLHVHNLEGLGVAGVIVGCLQIFAGVGIMGRRESAYVVGLILAGVSVLLNFAYNNVLDGWGFTGLFWNLLIIIILCLRAEEFKTGAA